MAGSATESGLPPEGASAAGAPVVIGRVARPFGRRGEVVVDPLTDRCERFFDLESAEVGPPGAAGVRRPVASVRMHRGRPVVRFDGVTDISGAEDLRRSEIRVREDERAPLPSGRFYFDDLVGCRAEDPEGDPLGEIVGVEDTAGPCLLVLRRREGGEALVPFVEALCETVDLEASRIVMRLPEGLLGLNDAGSNGAGSNEAGSNDAD